MSLLMSLLTAYDIDNLVKDHSQPARTANLYTTASAQQPGATHHLKRSESWLKIRIASILKKLHLATRLQA